jgi:phosphatidylglycerol lysyltransferase
MRSVDDRQKARALVMAYGRNATAFQILNPGIGHWFNERGDAVVGYVRRGGWSLVAGEPVCAPESLPGVVDEFEAWTRGRNLQVCYVCAAGSMRDLTDRSTAHSSITIGAQPVWNPFDWPAIVRTRASLRAQLHRSLNKGVRIESLPPAEGADNAEIRQTLREWLQSRLLPPMHFLVEPEVLSGVVDGRLLFVARREGRIVAFLVASPVAARNGYLVEELARSPRAPNGTSELLIDAAMTRFAEVGCTYATMGLVALAQGTGRENPFWLRSLMAIARAHANRFYNFRGLEHFRAKMHPDYWEPIYAISNKRHFSPQALYAVGGAFSGISPIRAIAIAILKGAREELGRLAAQGQSRPRAPRLSENDALAHRVKDQVRRAVQR